MPSATIEGAVERTVDMKKYYFASLRSSLLRGLTYVPLLEPNPKPCPYLEEQLGGYQRFGSVTRMRLFREYLKESPNSKFVPPLLLSAQNWRFERSGGASEYGRLIAEDAAAIVDGQHRAGGYIAAFEEDGVDRVVDVLCYVGLSREEEERLFLDINSTQKGVDKGLSAFLKGGPGVEIAEALNMDSDSPFVGRIAKQKLTSRQLFKLHSFVGGVEKTFAHGRISALSVDDKVDALKRYWSIIADVFTDCWTTDMAILDDASRGRSEMGSKLLELTGFLTWSYLGPQILGEAYVDSHGFNWSEIARRIQACEGLDWRKDGQYEGRTGSAGASHLKTEIERLLPPTGAGVVEAD
jgi:DNA sulfur modification protein DndB